MHLLKGANNYRLGLGGPMVPEAKQPPAYKLAILPSKESVTWRFSLRIRGFGRISIQPFVLLPVQVPFEQGKRTCPAQRSLCAYCPWQWDTVRGPDECRQARDDSELEDV